MDANDDRPPPILGNTVVRDIDHASEETIVGQPLPQDIDHNGFTCIAPDRVSENLADVLCYDHPGFELIGDGNHLEDKPVFFCVPSGRCTLALSATRIRAAHPLTRRSGHEQVEPALRFAPILPNYICHECTNVSLDPLRVREVSLADSRSRCVLLNLHEKLEPSEFVSTIAQPRPRKERNGPQVRVASTMTVLEEPDQTIDGTCSFRCDHC
ncbi:MAG: hypothetical protein V3W34_12235 [Phycisphaerae bacterium]